MFPGTTTLLKKGAHIGHGAIIHGGTIGENCLIGMNSVIMDEVIIEGNCIVGALSFVAAKTTVPERSLLVGNPAKVIKSVSDEMLAWKTKGTELYQQLPRECFETMNECEPLEVEESNRPAQDKLFETWKSIQGK
jgi:phenylacetic acid degradation protein/carnitine operon protein CaiE